MSDALYEQRDGKVFATEYTRGPWDPGAQHGGPAAAILTRAIEALDDGGHGLQIARLTFELLKPVPLGELQVSAQVVRPGKRVQFALNSAMPTILPIAASNLVTSYSHLASEREAA